MSLSDLISQGASLLGQGGASGPVVTLGGVTFQDFEVPEVINGGGDQALVVHKFPGGARVIDAMGVDDADITWAGRFRGANAEGRCGMLDEMRKAGQPVTLSWSTLLYTVVIRQFTFQYEAPFEIPYSIACSVLVDPNVLTAANVPPSISDVIGSDLSDALGISANLNLSDISNNVQQLQTAVATVASLTGASPATIAKIRSALSTTQMATQTAITAANAGVSGNGVGGVITGVQMTAAAASLTKTASSLGQLSQLYNLKAILGRMSTNIGSLGG